MRHYVSTPLNRACEWRIVVQRSVRIARIGLQHPAQVRLAEYDYVVDAFTTDRPDLSTNAFCHGEPGAIGLSRMPMARNRRATAAP